MKKRFIFISILAIMTAACAESEWEPASQTDVSTSPHSENNRTLEEALAYADDWFAQMDEPTRSEGRRVESVEYVSSASRTRSGDADTLMYLVNYEDNAGFALLGRPATSKAIYAISEEGSLDMSDTVYNKPLAMFMASARADANTTMFTTINSTRGLTIPTNPIKLETRIIRQRKPMLDSIGKIGKWSQTYPYNQACPIINKNVGYTGCGPLAVGMLMAYYRYPSTMYSDYPNLKTKIPWNLIIEKNNTIAISTLLEA
ncbi:MAG: C10 family peptidase, partial [Muribaculaceae bacterium]|nr:C10 family peptidase [Muribaculaceae bacterium]